MKYFFIILLGVFTGPLVHAQLCTGSLGEPVVNITFGEGSTPFDFGPELAPGITTLKYVKNKCPANGEYSIIATTSGCFGQWHAASDHTGMKPDGTKQSPNGYFMCIDADYAASDFYVQKVDNLCPGTTYEFGAWIVNMFNVGGGTLPNITFSIEKTDGTVLQTYNSGNIVVTIPFTWKQYSFFFVTPSDVSNVVLRMRNNAPGGGGNDLGLDDITFRPAGPKSQLTAPGGSNNSVSICSGSSSKLDITAVVDNCYPSTAYQWQESKDNGVTWNDIPGATSSTYTKLADMPGSFLYRLAISQMGGMGITSCRVYSTPYTVLVTSSVTSSVSITGSKPASICSGTPVSFTATPVNGGTSPVYQWKLNGTNVGTNSLTYTNNALADGDEISCVLSSSLGCQVPANSNIIKMLVTPSVTPGISIAASTNGICEGNPVTFTAAPLFGGVTPIYQWKLNGNNAGTNSPSFTSSTLANGDVISCVLTNNEVCATTPTATSNSITMNTAVPAPPSLTITADANNTCPGVPVNFKAVPTRGGTVPAYQWQVNGINAGSNSSDFTSKTLANGDIVTCTLTSNETCVTTPTAQSNAITINIINAVAPTVTIAESNNNICEGSTVTFTATPVNGGTAPIYQWKLNGTVIGSNSSAYTNNSLSNGDEISCVLTGNLGCQSPVASNSIKMTVIPVVKPALTISASTNGICAGATVSFTAAPVNEGTAPVYQWKLNGNNTGSNSPVFSSSTLSNGDVITCTLTNNAVCAVPATATSNSITMKATVPVTPSVTISNQAGSICPGDPVTFKAVPANGGDAPTYQWQVNGISAGSNSPDFSSNTLVNGDKVSCLLTSNYFCITAPTAISNNVMVSVNPLVTPSIGIAGSDNVVCAGVPVTFTATPVNEGTSPVYQWMVNGMFAGNNSPVFTSNALSNGDIITCKLTSSLACAVPASSNNIAMTINTRPVIVMGGNKVIEKGTSVQLAPQVSGNIQSYNWFPPASLNNSAIINPFASPLITTVYTLKTITTDNCADSASITVKVLIPIVIPNAFSPNGDGINDLWNIKGLADYAGCTVQIFNRYGQLIFQSNGYSRQWDGTSNGKPLPVGEYYYVINPGNGDPKMAGGVTLLR